jgi:hypothetical protein
MEEGTVITAAQTPQGVLAGIEETFGIDGDGYEVTLTADEELGLRIIWDALAYLEDPEWFHQYMRGRDSSTRKFWGKRYARERPRKPCSCSRGGRALFCECREAE